MNCEIYYCYLYKLLLFSYLQIREEVRNLLLLFRQIREELLEFIIAI